MHYSDRGVMNTAKKAAWSKVKLNVFNHLGQECKLKPVLMKLVFQWHSAPKQSTFNTNAVTQRLYLWIHRVCEKFTFCLR